MRLLDPRLPPRSAARRLRYLCCALLAGLGLALPHAAPAQEAVESSLRLSGVNPAGIRGNATESWGAFTFGLTNYGDTDRLARVLVLYEPLEHVQYGRDVWVPAHSVLSS